MLKFLKQKKILPRHQILFTLALICIALFLSCKYKRSVYLERAFYYWKSNDYPSNNEVMLCDSLHVNKMYIKFFEVNYNVEQGHFPEAKNYWYYRFGMNRELQEVVPTVFLRNVVFLNSSKADLDILADNVNFLIQKYCKEKLPEDIKVVEFQMDCDWTLKTRDNYFYFLKKLKALSHKQISCTLRLYPYKYPDKMGVPPVDRATLMCYNLLNPLQNPRKNSIIDLDELRTYLNVDKKYPLRLDIALPIYSWAQVYHNERFSGVFYTNTKQLKRILKQEKMLWFTVTKDTVLDDKYLRVGDKIKFEEVDAQKIKMAIKIIKNKIDLDANATIALFHLDEEQLNNFTNAELSDFYTAFDE